MNLVLELYRVASYPKVITFLDCAFDLYTCTDSKYSVSNKCNCFDTVEPHHVILGNLHMYVRT